MSLTMVRSIWVSGIKKALGKDAELKFGKMEASTLGTGKMIKHMGKGG